MEENKPGNQYNIKQSLQVLQIQMEIMAELDAVKKFLELQQKAVLISELIRKEKSNVEV